MENVSKNKTQKDEKVSFSKRVTKGDSTIEWTVKQVENGFVITKMESSEGKKGWAYDEKTYISATNPLEKKPEFDLGTDLVNDFQFEL